MTPQKLTFPPLSGSLTTRNIEASASASKLLDKGVRAETPNSPRAAVRSLFAAIKTLGTRMLNAVAPEGVRTHEKLQQLGPQVNLEVGNLVAVLVDPPAADDVGKSPTPLVISTRLSSMESDMMKLGVDHKVVFHKRALQHLGTLSDDQFDKLRKNLKDSVLPGPHREAIATAMDEHDRQLTALHTSL